MQRAPDQDSAADVTVVPDAIAGTHWMSRDLSGLGAVLPAARSAPDRKQADRSWQQMLALSPVPPQRSSEHAAYADPGMIDLADITIATRVESRRALRVIPNADFVGVGASARRAGAPVKTASFVDHARLDDVAPEARPANENAARILRMIVLAAVIASGVLWTARQFSRSQAIVVPAPASDRSMIT